MDGRQYRVVVADDAADMRLLLSVALSASGRFEIVGEATNGREAVDIATATQPDLTVLDLSMPVMDGLEALPLIRAHAPSATVVVLSGLDESLYADQVRASGAAEFVGKGLLPDEIVARLLDVLEPGGPRRAHEISQSFPPTPTSAGEARQFVKSVLVEHGQESLVDTAMLLTSELVSNAIVHAASGPDVNVTIGERIRVSVTDHGHGALVMRDVDEYDVDGRGLHIVECLARAWGTAADGDLKIVWFEL